MELLAVNSVGGARRMSSGGRDYLVVPLTMIVPGVLAGSSGPLLYPPDEIARSAGAWEGVPITLQHPFDPATGAYLSAGQGDALARQGVGMVRNPRIRNGKLVAQGWFDEGRLRAVHPGVHASVSAGRPVELSTGLFTENEPVQGTHLGRPYSYIAREYRPDHLAVLPDTVGACSIRDGCGVGIANEVRRDEHGRFAASDEEAAGAATARALEASRSAGKGVGHAEDAAVHSDRAVEESDEASHGSARAAHLAAARVLEREHGKDFRQPMGRNDAEALSAHLQAAEAHRVEGGDPRDAAASAAADASAKAYDADRGRDAGEPMLRAAAIVSGGTKRTAAAKQREDIALHNTAERLHGELAERASTPEARAAHTLAQDMHASARELRNNEDAAAELRGVKNEERPMSLLERFVGWLVSGGKPTLNAHRVCSECGAECGQDDEECPECGAKLVDNAGQPRHADTGQYLHGGTAPGTKQTASAVMAGFDGGKCPECGKTDCDCSSTRNVDSTTRAAELASEHAKKARTKGAHRVAQAAHAAAAEHHEDDEDLSGKHRDAAAYHGRMAEPGLQLHEEGEDMGLRRNQPGHSLEGVDRDQQKAAFAKMGSGESGGSATKGALSASQHAESTGTAGAHRVAQTAHKEAAEHHADKGNEELREKHARKAAYHGREAAKASANNERVQALIEAGIIGNSDRGHALRALNAKAEGSNADVSEDSGSVQAGGEEDDDDAEPAPKAKFKRVAANAKDRFDMDDEDDGDGDGDDDDDDEAKQRRNSAPSADAWLKGAPKEIRSVFNEAFAIQRQEKRRLVQKLTSNMANGSQKDAAQRRFMEKDANELRDLLAMFGGRRQENSSAYPTTPPPSFLGASGVAANASFQTEDDKSDILPLPEIDYKDWANSAS